VTRENETRAKSDGLRTMFVRRGNARRRKKKTPRVHSDTRRRLAFLLVCLPTLVISAAATNDLCGATIFANLKLDQDLTCGGNGLTIGADGITIDLNGHTIAGPGSGVGISVSNRAGVVISGGR